MIAPNPSPLDRWVAGKLGVPEARLSDGALDAYQLERLREMFDWARERSPFYRAHLARVPPMSTLSDLRHVPFTTADDVRTRGAQLLCVSQDEVSRVVTLRSSGTTGPPKRLHFTAGDQEATIDFFQHGMATLVGRGDRVLILLPGEVQGSVGALLAEALRRLEATPIPHGFVSDLPAAIAVFRRERPTSLVGAPVQALALARFGEEVAKERFQLRTALLTTDHVPDAIVRALEGAWGCEVFEHYGMTEMGLGGAVDCAAHAGYHLREPDLYVEIVDRATGEPLPEGARGEIVFTTLGRRGMPLIRYRTGDLSRFLPGPCPCGAKLRRLERVRGRIAELRLSGDLTTPALDDSLFKVPGLVDYTAALARSERPTRLEITAFTFRDDEATLKHTVEERLESVPATGAAMRAGALKLRVTTHRLGDRLLRGPEKRTLMTLEDRDGA